MDIFARAAWQQQMFVQRMAADLDMLTGVNGAQVRCLECADFDVAAAKPTADSSWLAVLVKLLS